MSKADDEQFMRELREIVLGVCERQGESDARAGVTVPPAEFCEDNNASKAAREAWLRGWNRAMGTPDK